MSDSEDDHTSGEDDDYVPSGAEYSDEDYDDETVAEDGKNATFLPPWLEGTGQDEEDSTTTRKKKTGKKDSCPKRNRKGGIKLDDREDNDNGEENEESDKGETVNDLTQELSIIKEKKLELKSKEKAEDLWNMFLKDVGQPSKPKETSDAEEESLKKGDSNSTSSSSLKKSMAVERVEEEKTVTITKIFDFAGEKVKVKEKVDRNSKEAKEYLTESTSKNPVTLASTSGGFGLKRSGAGLGGILNKINKKSKINTLEKSRLDWNSFKDKEGIDDDLKIHNKGKHGFLEKQAFLERADQRQYEVEKSFRLGLNKSTR